MNGRAEAPAADDSLFTLANLFRQYESCRRRKRNTHNALRFEVRQEMNLLALRDALVSRRYQPGRSVCFFVRRPKLREVFAADFVDRIVHHVLVEHLERTWERIFIHDSYACRRQRGVHAAVARLQRFMREATANGTREAFALQLDVRNYFMSIDKQTLFAMDALDQFVKHELRCRWYLRYCDDFVLLAHSTQELRRWRDRIASFLAQRLLLELNPRRQKLQPIADGVDFLGYIVHPFQLLVRRRVIGHLREQLRRCQGELVRTSGATTVWRFDSARLDALQASLASCLGHFRWAACHRLVAELWRAHPWLSTFFDLDVHALTLRRRDRPLADGRTVLDQYRHWCLEYREDEVWIQVGAFIERLQWPPRDRRRRVEAVGGPATGLRRMRVTRRGAIEGFPLAQLSRRVSARLNVGRSVLLVMQVDGGHGAPLQRVPMYRWCRAHC